LVAEAQALPAPPAVPMSLKVAIWMVETTMKIPWFGVGTSQSSNYVRRREFSGRLRHQGAATALMAALGVNDLDRAEEVAQSTEHSAERSFALAVIARHLIPLDPQRAARLLLSAASDYRNVDLMVRVGAAVVDLESATAKRLFAEAERIARGAPDDIQAIELAEIARGMEAYDPARAGRLRADADESARALTGHRLAWTLAALAELDPAYPEPSDDDPWTL
jgi:hypothetical protein